MSRILITEKPNGSLESARAATEIFDFPPNCSLPIVHVNSFFGMVQQFAWPRNLKWADLPYMDFPRFKPVSASNLPLPSRSYNSSLDKIDRQVDFDVDVLFSEVTQIVISIPDDASEIHTVENFLRGVLGSRYQAVEKIWTWPFGDRLAPMPWEDLLPRKLNQSLATKRFLFSYSINACMLFGRVYEEAGLGSAASSEAKSTLGSSSALQFLYHLRKAESLSFEDAYDAMGDWRGTGRYSDRYKGLSTARSRDLTLRNLEASGIVDIDRDEHQNETMTISPKGLKFMAGIHPASEDPDQNFRLRDWSQLDLDSAAAKIDRYIGTFFKRQKNPSFRARG